VGGWLGVGGWVCQCVGVCERGGEGGGWWKGGGGGLDCPCRTWMCAPQKVTMAHMKMVKERYDWPICKHTRLPAVPRIADTASQPWSKSSPKLDDEPVRRACLPSSASKVWYLQSGPRPAHRHAARGAFECIRQLPPPAPRAHRTRQIPTPDLVDKNAHCVEQVHPSRRRGLRRCIRAYQFSFALEISSPGLGIMRERKRSGHSPGNRSKTLRVPGSVAAYTATRRASWYWGHSYGTRICQTHTSDSNLPAQICHGPAPPPAT